MKILLYTDLTIRSQALFWHRDLGLLTKAFRELGHDAHLVVHPATQSTHNPKRNIRHGPVIWASPSEVRNPSWWQAHKPGLVVLGLWTRPKYDPIRRAALSATSRVIERADSDGMRTASCGLLTYALRRYDYFRDRSYRWPTAFSFPSSVFYSFASILATPRIEARLARTLRLLPAVAVETPHATTLWKNLTAKVGANPRLIHCIPHPIQTNIFMPNPSVPKTNQVISVGRWDAYQKNLPLLLKTLIAFLRQNPDWTSLVVGSGLPPTPPHPRIRFSAPLSAKELSRRMQASRLLLSLSRYESFGLSLAEGLCCGCLPVGPPSLGPLDYFQSFFGGSVSLADLLNPNDNHLLFPDGALVSKATERACRLFSPREVAGQLVAISESL